MVIIIIVAVVAISHERKHVFKFMCSVLVTFGKFGKCHNPSICPRFRQ